MYIEVHNLHSSPNIVRAINQGLDCETSGSHGGEYEDGCLLGCCVV
jgi:hypothetical protein